MEPTGDIAIRTLGLTKRYKRLTAVDDLHLEVHRGDVFGFLGPNGAGKTTTIALLLGLVHPTAGTAEVLGRDVRRDLVLALRRTGAIIETPAFYPYLSARDNLRIAARTLGLADDGLLVDTPAERAADVTRALAEAGLYLAGLRLLERTLESVFLKAVGNGDERAASDG